jgi:2-methylcitrate dehydratase PrpD
VTATTTVADFVATSRAEDCPAPAMAAARRAIRDCFGVMLAGAGKPAARILQSVARAEGGAPLCTIVGTGRRTGALWAALCNGTAAHTHDLNTDTDVMLMGHPSASLLAAALASGELALADGQSLIHAFLLGFEVETTLAAVINSAPHDHDGRATSTLGTLGAAAATARLFGLDAAQVRAALAVAASQSSGVQENFGTMTEPFHAGHAARSGVLAALLAREGWTASDRALEGPQGFVSVLGAERLQWDALDTLGAPWKILTSGAAVKPHPSCAPLSAGALREKFSECARLVLSEDRADSVAQMLESLETCPDVRSLTAILGP